MDRTWTEPRERKRNLRRAEYEVRKLERALGGPGALDKPTPGYEWLTLRKRVLIRLERGDTIPFCKVCKKPYINDTARTTPTCKGRCEDIYRERKKAVEEGLKKFAGKYDPRVDVRLRLNLPIKACKQCGIPFPDYHPRQLYCSKRCCNKAWYARNPLHKCAWCGEKFRGKRKTCSARCAKKHDYYHKVRCARCEKVIEPGREIAPNEDTRLPVHRPGSRWDKQPVVFCSGRCRDALGWSPSRKVCPECNEAFYPESKIAQKHQIYCGDACQRRAELRRRAEARAALRSAMKVCGEPPPPLAAAEVLVPRIPGSGMG